MEIVKQRFEMVELDGDVDRIKPHPQNPNLGDDVTVDESVDVNGFYGTVIAQESTGYVLAGHTRLRTAVRKKAEAIPVMWVDVDDETALRILLVDNEATRRGRTDDEKLDEILQSLPSLEGTGYDLTPVEEAIRAEAAAEEAPPAPSALPGPDDIPDDVHEPAYGVMMLCDSEEHQAAVYEAMQHLAEVGVAEDDPLGLEPLTRVQLRVVAI